MPGSVQDNLIIDNEALYSASQTSTQLSSRKCKVFLLYQYFYPDDVISARLFSDLAIALAKAGQEVIALPSVRSCHGISRRYQREQQWDGGLVRRIWRPNFRQSSNLGRVLNSLFMLIGWAWKAAFFQRSKRNGPQETVIIGSDPIFGVLAAIPWRLFRPRSRIIHWCHDVHPEASVADGAISSKSFLIRALRVLLRCGYRRCNVVVDLGSCMRELLAVAGGWDRENTVSSPAPHLQTITPWSLVEPPSVVQGDTAIRAKLFGTCKLALLYSGNLGRAHDFQLLLELARKCRNQGIHFCFAGRGPGIDRLQSQLSDDDENVSTAGFADEAELQARLAACDIHMVSLKDSWTGTVVPSKFFGALSIGRPVLFAGSEHCCISRWIRNFQVGWHITDRDIDSVYQEIVSYAANPKLHSSTNERCWYVYQQHFSHDVQIKKWFRLTEPNLGGERTENDWD